MIFNYSTLNFNAILFTATFPVHAVLASVHRLPVHNFRCVLYIQINVEHKPGHWFDEVQGDETFVLGDVDLIVSCHLSQQVDRHQGSYLPEKRWSTQLFTEHKNGFSVYYKHITLVCKRVEIWQWVARGRSWVSWSISSEMLYSSNQYVIKR